MATNTERMQELAGIKEDRLHTNLTEDQSTDQQEEMKEASYDLISRLVEEVDHEEMLVDIFEAMDPQTADRVIREVAEDHDLV